MARGNIGKVIVVGAGPVGLLTALLLAKKGIPVEILEAQSKVNESPRGLAYGLPAVKVLQRAGVLEETIKRGFIPKDVAWRHPDGEYIIGFNRLEALADGLPRSVVLPVGSLSTLLLEEVQKYSNATIHWGHRVIGVGQDDNNGWVDVEEHGSTLTKRLHAKFVIGCDGAGSAVRKALSGGSFPGYTWPQTLVAVNVSADFDKLEFSDVQWIIHPENWFVIARIDKRGLWRVVYGEAPGLSAEEIRARLPDRFRKTLPGHPEPEEYRIQNVTPYTVHQRCAEKMRVGRVLMAGDAAHLNNPMGGLGLTTGVSDVGSLIDCLYGIHDGKASLDILDKYDEIRRKIFNQVTDVTSTANFRRIMQSSENVAGSDPFFQLLAKVKEDPNVAAALLSHELSIGCDMTQFYDKVITRN
ncbi:uncharacterized protein A1O9_02250 [Exophiala aquamarina CBS 119918]|uniref:FAD-binding domain-containing protein n=1 Tax=Exophiala aquamarina CBS 119918 TaxID=1182545 RepID=A0A072PKR3_9EURO|nr:uncharacterized protein A1O9_02250 [Exophiala aquamarina CBS 119918]KEF60689.1 hypothetical protein A1O9_02250 [Exophiala aquamarina CBS 119918]